MDLPSVLLAHLRQLTAADADADGVSGTLAELVVQLASAVPSYRGLQVTIIDHGFPIVLTAFTTSGGADGVGAGADGAGVDGAGVDGAGVDGAGVDDAVRTSLRLPLGLLSGGVQEGSQIVVYAGTAGSLVDLGADLAYALDPARLGPPRAPVDDSVSRDVTAPRPAVVLDLDLPPSTRTSGLSGLTELSTINRAIGMMIETGHHPDDAHATLRRHAAAVGLDPHDWAVRLLSR